MKDRFYSDSREKEKIELNRSKGAGALYDWIKTILITFAIFAFIFLFVFRIVRVDGPSMNSTLENGDMVILTDIFYTPRDGDIVVVSHAAEHEKPIIKRVIATEGQTLQLDYENDRVIVNGVILDEDYINNGITFGSIYPDYEIPETIPKGKVFVMGDNRRESKDSRDHRIGLINSEDIIGKAQVLMYPFGDRFGYLY